MKSRLQTAAGQTLIDVDTGQRGAGVEEWLRSALTNQIYYGNDESAISGSVWSHARRGLRNIGILGMHA
jgi:hypothetical protein